MNDLKELIAQNKEMMDMMDLIIWILLIGYISLMLMICFYIILRLYFTLWKEKQEVRGCKCEQ